MVNQNCSTRKWGALVPGFLVLMALVFVAGVSCKKKKSGGGASAPPAANINSGDGTSGCDSALTTLDLGPADPASLRLVGVDLEEFKIGSFSSARIIFSLAEGSPPPSKFVYYACSAQDKKNCKLGSSGTSVDVNSVIPAGAVSIKAWACITPNRLPGPPANFAKYRLDLKNLGVFYCGSPVEHFDYQRSNTSVQEFANVQAEIDYLETQAKQVAFALADVVEDHLNQRSMGLAEGTGSVCDNPRDAAEAALCNIANNPDLFADSVLSGGSQAGTLEAGVAANKSGSTGSYSLTNSSGNPCIPSVPTGPIEQLDPKPFTPPTVTKPSTVPTVETATDTTKPAPKEPAPATTTPAATDKVADMKANCQNRNEWFASQNLGSAEWDENTQRCFHKRADGKETEIDVSIDPALLEPPPDEETYVEVETGMSTTQKFGVGFIVAGAAMGIGSAGVIGHELWKQKNVHVNQEKAFSAVTSGETLRGQIGTLKNQKAEIDGEFAKVFGPQAKAHYQAIDPESLLTSKALNGKVLTIGDQKLSLNTDFTKRIEGYGVLKAEVESLKTKRAEVLETSGRQTGALITIDNEVIAKQTELRKMRTTLAGDIAGDFSDSKGLTFTKGDFDKVGVAVLELDKTNIKTKQEFTKLLDDTKFSGKLDVLDFDKAQNKGVFSDLAGKYQNFGKLKTADKLKYGGLVAGAAAVILGVIIYNYGLTSESEDNILNNPGYLAQASQLQSLLDEIDDKKTEAAAINLQYNE